MSMGCRYSHEYSVFWNAFGIAIYTPQTPAQGILTAKASGSTPPPSLAVAPQPQDTSPKPKVALDLNGDGVVDERDANAILTLYGKKKGDSGFRSEADLNGDGQIDLIDLALMTAGLGSRK
jgi:hypothetical protein